MKIINNYYSADLDWVEDLAQQFEGKVEDNFIKVPVHIATGVRYVVECEEGIVAYYIDVKYNMDVRLMTKNKKKDFIGFYYNLTDGKAISSGENFTYDVSRWYYNLSVIDSALETNYQVASGSSTFAFFIFIKKDIIESFATKNNITLPRNAKEILDPQRNTVIRFDRMSSESFHLLYNLRKEKVGGPIFELQVTGIAQLLLADYLKEVSAKKIISYPVDKSDFNAIIDIQKYLIENIEGDFPNIISLARIVNMSESKFKKLFVKISGCTTKQFFMENKLLLAKELIESKQYTITEISDRLSFSNSSHFAFIFRRHFGISPSSLASDL